LKQTYQQDDKQSVDNEDRVRSRSLEHTK